MINGSDLVKEQHAVLAQPSGASRQDDHDSRPQPFLLVAARAMKGKLNQTDVPCFCFSNDVRVP